MLKLSYTTKMPGASFSLPAGFTCTSLCTVPCYAKKGFYRMPAAKGLREENYETVLELLAIGKGALAKELVRLIDEDRSSYFRIHDSGDFFLPEYVDEWTQVGKEMPYVRFWAPTKAWVLPDILPRLREFNRLPNVTIRPSGLGDVPFNTVTYLRH